MEPTSVYGSSLRVQAENLMAISTRPARVVVQLKDVEEILSFNRWAAYGGSTVPPTDSPS